MKTLQMHHWSLLLSKFQRYDMRYWKEKEKGWKRYFNGNNSSKKRFVYEEKGRPKETHQFYLCKIFHFLENEIKEWPWYPHGTFEKLILPMVFFCNCDPFLRPTPMQFGQFTPQKFRKHATWKTLAFPFWNGKISVKNFRGVHKNQYL